MTKKPAKTTKIDGRHILKLVVVICVVAATIMLLRAYFLDHPPVGAPLDTDITNLGQNSLTTLDSVNTDLDGSSRGIWGSDIGDALSLPPTQGMWLSVNNTQGINVGELVNNEFFTRHILPLNTVWFRLYADQSLLYYTLSSNTADAKLVGITGGQSSELVHLPAGWEFNSAFFDPVQKQFYLDIYDRSGKSKIQVVRQGTGSLDVVDTSVYPQPLILNVDIANHLLHFKGSPNGHDDCYTLNLVDKQITGKNCDAIQTTANNLVFTTNSAELKMNAGFKGSILQTNTANGSKAFIKVGEVGDIFSKIYANDKFMTILYSKIEEEDIVVKSIRSYEVSTGNQHTELQPLPEDVIFPLVDRSGKLFAVLASAEHVQELWRPPVDAEIEWRQLELAICPQTCDFAAL